MKRRTYLDWASAARVLPKPHRAFIRAFVAQGNPSSVHAEGQEARRILEDARTRIARLAGAKSDAVIFTSGATEANALAISGLIAGLRASESLPAHPHVLYLPSAHASVVETVHALSADGFVVEPLALAGASVDVPAFAKQIRPETVLVTMDAVCGETGVRFATRDVRRALDAAQAAGGKRIYLHVDGSQMPFVESIDRMHIGADLLTLDAQKVGAVRGIGALIAPMNVPLAPLMLGGGQERGLRPGTESPALAASFTTALEEAQEGRARFIARATDARAAAIARIHAAIPDILVNESQKPEDQAPHILNLSFSGRDTDYAVMLMNDAGIAASTRSACETDSADGSRAVTALFGDTTRASSTLRLSWGPNTSSSAVMRGARALIRAIRFLDEHVV